MNLGRPIYLVIFTIMYYYTCIPDMQIFAVEQGLNLVWWDQYVYVYQKDLNIVVVAV